MKVKSAKSIVLNHSKLGHENLKDFFIDHLNKIYCAKAHLTERLPEILDKVSFIDLQHVIAETIDVVEKELARMDEIYHLLNSEYSFENCGSMIGYLEDEFAAIHLQNESSSLLDLSILFYMQNIQSMEIASFQVLLIAVNKFKDKLIKKLLKENFEEAKAERKLLLLLINKYM